MVMAVEGMGPEATAAELLAEAAKAEVAAMEAAPAVAAMATEEVTMAA